MNEIALDNFIFFQLFKNGDVGFPPTKGYNANESCIKREKITRP
jgi:hypothetical protein